MKKSLIAQLFPISEIKFKKISSQKKYFNLLK